MTERFGEGWSTREDLPEAHQAAQRWQELTAPAPEDTPGDSSPASSAPEPTPVAADAADLPAYTAYAGGDPVAILGGRGVSKPASEILAAARAKPDVASLVAAANARSLQAEPIAAGVER